MQVLVGRATVELVQPRLVALEPLAGIGDLRRGILDLRVLRAVLHGLEAHLRHGQIQLSSCQLALRLIALGLQLSALGLDAAILDGIQPRSGRGDGRLRLVHARLKLCLCRRAAAASQLIELALSRFDPGVGRLHRRVGGGFGFAARGAVVRNLLPGQRIGAVGARRVDTLLERRLLRFSRLMLRLRLLDGGLGLRDLRLGRVVPLSERGPRRGELRLSLIHGGLRLLDVGRSAALQVVERGIGGADRGLSRRDAGRQRVDLALGSLKVRGVVAAQGGVGRFGARERSLVRVDCAASRLDHVVGRAFLQRGQFGVRRVDRVLRLLHRLGPTALQHQIEPRLLRVEACQGDLHIFGAPAVEHVLQMHLLLDQRCLGGGHVVGSGARLERGELRLGAGQARACLQRADLRAFLLEDRQRVARFDATADVDQHPVDTPRGLWQNADLLACADVAAVGQRLLNVATRGVLRADACSRHGRWRGGRRRGVRSRGTRGQQKGGRERATDHDGPDRKPGHGHSEPPVE